MYWWCYSGAFGRLSYWWCSCGHVQKGWSRPGCRGRRWWGTCSHTCREMGRWFQWCYMTSRCHRPALWRPCSTPPAAPRPTPPSSCLLWAPPPRCSLGDTGLTERETFISYKSEHHLLEDVLGNMFTYAFFLRVGWEDRYHSYWERYQSSHQTTDNESK